MFKARPIQFTRKEGQLEDGWVYSQVGPLPWVARFSEDYLREIKVSPTFRPEAMGFRFLHQESGFLVSCYARPWWVWRLLKWFPRLCRG